MGWRFRKSIKLAPDIKINLSKNGLSSVSFGKPGSTVNMGRKGTKGTFGLPGSGISYSQQTSNKPSLGNGLALAALVLFVRSALRGNKISQWLLAISAVTMIIILIIGSENHSQINTLKTEVVHQVIPQSSPQTITIPRPAEVTQSKTYTLNDFFKDYRKSRTDGYSSGEIVQYILQHSETTFGARLNAAKMAGYSKRSKD